MPKNILVTGANGYLGGHVVKELKEAGHRLNLMNSHGEMISVLSFPPEAVEVVVHLGWYASVGNKHKEIQVECLQRTKSLIEIMYQFQPQFIFASSAAVYGNCQDVSCEETKTKIAPNCYYSEAKALAEREIHAKLKRHMMFRFGSMMGVGAEGGRTKTDLVVNAFAKDGWGKGEIEVWNPECWKPFIHVKDAAFFIRYAVEKRWRGVANCCQGNMAAIDIAMKVAAITNAKVKEVEVGGEKKSCRLNCWRLRRFMPRDYIMRTMPETIYEFKGYQEKPEDMSKPWGERSRLLRV